jgi:Leucine-rich repeat (LRR) protein
MRRRGRQLAPGFGSVAPEGKTLDIAVREAKQSGAINLSSRNLEEFPQEIAQFSDLRIEGNWWEALDLQRVDLSHNRIQSIPANLASQGHLTILRMSNNLLTSLPGELFTLQTLKLVDFSFNHLSTLPESLTNCVSLVEILLRNNQIRELPYDFGNLVGLEILDISENELTSLPRSCTNLLTLKKLDVSSNHLTQFDSTIGCLFRLQELYAKKNLIERLEPQSLIPLINLRLLDLRENRLTVFDQFPASNNLDSVLLGYNRIIVLAGIEQATGLTVLDVQNNKLKELPAGISRLNILKTLDVSNNDLGNLPNELAGLKSLVRLNIEGNPLRSIRQSVRSSGTEAIKKYLAYRQEQPQEQKEAEVPNTWDEVLREASASGQLKLVSRNVDSIYPGVWQLPNLLLLDVSINQISVISAEIRMLRSLQIFRANKNRLESIPSLALAGLDQLVELELSGNMLSGFFEDLTFDTIHMDRLRRLDLSSNRLTALPPCLVCFPGLRVLIAHTNRIPDLELLCSPAFKALEGLDVSSNQISELLEVFCTTLVNLIDLNLENNNITVLPPVLGYSPRLKSLRVEGNPLKTVRRPIVEKGSATILEYLRNKAAAPPPETTQPMEVEEPPPPQPQPTGPGRTELELEIVGLKAQIQHLGRRLDEDFALTVTQRRELQRELAGMRNRFAGLERLLVRF